MSFIFRFGLTFGGSLDVFVQLDLCSFIHRSTEVRTDKSLLSRPQTRASAAKTGSNMSVLKTIFHLRVSLTGKSEFKRDKIAK